MLSGCMNIIEQGVRWLAKAWFGSKKKRFRETLYIYFAWRSRGPPGLRGIAMIQDLKWKCSSTFTFSRETD